MTEQRSTGTAVSAVLPPATRPSAFWRILPAGMRKRWWLFRLFDLLAYHWPVAEASAGVLVVRMDGIGDMVLFRRALHYYADVFGVEKSAITVLGCESWSTISDVLFEGYRVKTINEHAYARRPLYRLAVNIRVRRMAPAVCVNDSYFRRALMADSLTWVARAPKTVTSVPYISERTRPEFTYYMSQVSDTVDTGPYPTHEIIRHFRFLSAITGRDFAPEPPSLHWRDDEPLLEAGAPYIVLNPGSNELGRRWPVTSYADLAATFLGRGYRVAVVGKSEEQAWERAFDAMAGDPSFFDLTGRTKVPQLLDLLNHAALVVTNDTGPAHLSIGLDTPTVVIVGGGHFGCFVPYPPEVAPDNARFVYHKMDCYHCFWLCHKRTGKSDPFPCVAEVTTAQVKAACAELLSEKLVPTAG